MSRPRNKPSGLPIVNDKAAAIDIGSRFHVVAVPPDLCGEPVQTFQAFTADLERMADWTVSLGIRTVAMESPGCTGSPRTILDDRGRRSDCRQRASHEPCPGARATSTMRSGCSDCMPAVCCARASGRAATSLHFEPTCGFVSGIWTTQQPTSSTCTRH